MSSCKSTQLKKSTTSIANFPKDWVGNYKGELQIYTVDSIAKRIDMSLKIQQKTDSLYDWEITYNMNDRKIDVRKYELNIIDKKTGHYLIDEKNTIKIDAFYKNKTLTSFFKVKRSFIIATYSKENENIIFEIIAASSNKPFITGNSTFEGEDIPEVKTFYINGRQKAVLKKVVAE